MAPDQVARAIAQAHDAFLRLCLAHGAGDGQTSHSKGVVKPFGPHQRIRHSGSVQALKTNARGAGSGAVATFASDPLGPIRNQTQHVGRPVQGGIGHGLNTELGWP